MRATNLLVFIVASHVLFFYAGSAGYVPFQTGENPDQTAYQNLTGSQLQDSLQGTNTSSTIDETFSIAEESGSFIDTITGIIFANQNVIAGLQLPDMIKTLLQVIISLLEIIAIGQFIRGTVF